MDLCNLWELNNDWMDDSLARLMDISSMCSNCFNSSNNLLSSSSVKADSSSFVLYMLNNCKEERLDTIWDGSDSREYISFNIKHLNFSSS